VRHHALGQNVDKKRVRREVSALEWRSPTTTALVALPRGSRYAAVLTVMPVIAFADYLADEVEMYVHGLRGFGFEVVPVTAEEPAEAAEIIRNTPCAAVVTRILPAKFGIKLIQALRARAITGYLPIVVITSFPSAQLRDEARAAGATDVLLLPQTPEQIARAVRRAIHHTPAA
jgi:CheY-like chemotaxis protein